MSKRIMSRGTHKVNQSLVQTEMDGVPVRKLFVAHFPYDTTRYNLKLAFKKFGDIENVWLSCQNLGNKNYAFVTFRETAAAKSALTRPVYLKNSRILVKPANARHQPDFVNPSVSMLPTVTQDCNGTIFMLNDDCLLEIFSYLEFSQLLKLSDVCLRFRSICEYIYSTKHKSLDLEKSPYLVFTELPTILEKIGPFLRSFKTNFDFVRCGDLLRMIAKYCTNLTSLSLKNFRIPYKVTTKYRDVFKKLRNLELVDCELSDQSLSHILLNSRYSKRISHLKVLNVSNNPFIGLALLDIVGLKGINLSFCASLQAVYFVRFLANNRELNWLELYKWYNLNTTCVEAIAKNLRQLKRLSLSGSRFNPISSKDLFPLAELTVLQHLQIHSITNVDAFLLKLIQKVPLSYLNLTDVHIKEDTLNALIAFKELQYLKVEGIQYKSNIRTDHVPRKLGRMF